MSRYPGWPTDPGRFIGRPRPGTATRYGATLRSRPEYRGGAESILIRRPQLRIGEITSDEGAPDPDAVANTATSETRASTLAARLRGVYGTVDTIDSVAGMIAEKHVPITIRNNMATAIPAGWTARFELANGQGIFAAANGTFAQSGTNGRDVTLRAAGATNRTIPANGSTPSGGAAGNIAFNASFDNVTNARPVNATLNGKRCATPFV